MKYLASIIIFVMGIFLTILPAFLNNPDKDELSLNSAIHIGNAMFIGIPIIILGIVLIMRCIKADNQNISK